MLDKKITHSIYLIKSEFVENGNFLQGTANCQQYNIPISGYPDAIAYLKTTPSNMHSWSDFLPANVSGIDWNQYRTRSLYGLLLIEVNDRLFALTSGFGRHLLHPFSVENRFGFKAVLNSIEPQTIQQLSKKTLSDNPKTSIEQVSKGVNIGQFGIDSFMDLIQRVKGKSRFENLGLSLDGEDALKISVAYELEEIPELLSECYDLYRSDGYQAFFPDIDNLSEVKDKEQRTLLNDNLETELNHELDKYLSHQEMSGNIWASIPEIVFDDDFDCFVYKNSANASRYYDIELKNIFREYYRKPDGSKRRDVSISSLTTNKIHIRKANGVTYQKWRALNCINAYVESNQEKFFYIEGKWYRASTAFIDTLDQKISNIPRSNFSFEDWSQHTKEKDYLESRPLTHNEEYLILDRNNIYLEGQKAVEPCDIYTQDKILIHLKRYGSAALLGHLFNQGYVSGDLLLNSIEFKEKFNAKLQNTYKFNDINPNDFTISYVIGTKYPNRCKLPLFSKITLTKAYDELRKKGYRVTLNFCKMTLN